MRSLPSPMSRPEETRRQSMEAGSIKKSNGRDLEAAVPSTEEGVSLNEDTES